MTPDEVRARVQAINVDDDEDAHGRTDSIWEDVLKAIAAGGLPAGMPMSLASEALKTNDLDFCRWYA